MLINARNRSIAVEGNRIVPEGGRYDVVIDCAEADVRPGLVNAHDHLHRNHYGRLGSGLYPNAYRWAEDIQVRFRRRIAQRRRVPRRAALLAGAWKNLFAGVTTVVHHDAWEEDFDRDFPIRVARIASADSLGMTPGFEPPAGAPFCLHLAEGVDDVAGSELAEVDRRGMLNSALIAIHGIALAGTAVDRFSRSGAALVWCPTSNHFLFGRSASAKLLDSGCDVLLGSDSRLSGEGDLLDEYQAARELNLLDDDRLERSVGATSASRFGEAEPSLRPGSKADVILLRKDLREARNGDVALTVVDGIPRVADAEVARKLGAWAEQGGKTRIGRTVRWTNPGRGVA